MFTTWLNFPRNLFSAFFFWLVGADGSPSLYWFGSGVAACIMHCVCVRVWYVCFALYRNYCAGGAADLDALVQFAMDSVQFAKNTPLLAVSHDPMIHPGKGVLGLRLNGVNNANLKNIEINNIQSQTKLGSLIANSYDFVVSQQAPYMKGMFIYYIYSTHTVCL